KGVKKISSKNAPACQLFVYSDFEFIEKFGRLTVKTATSKDLFYDMRADMTRYSLACYFAEILSHTCMENNDESESLRLFLNCLFALSYKKDIQLAVIKAVFELKLMCICGFMPDFENCIYCNEDAPHERNNIFSFVESGVLCNNCSAKLGKDSIPYSCYVSGDVISCMEYICASSQSKMLMFGISDENLRELSFVCENYLIHKTERTYETLKIYKSIISSLGEK
ncbi:MAG: DNA repair protein RecO, partial [Clostridia bacterium]|nr:DNA repair protein RecO [Clostridia bacterium]